MKSSERQRGVAEKPLREAVQGGHQRIIEREKTDAPQQTPAQGQRQPQRHAAGDGGRGRNRSSRTRCRRSPAVQIPAAKRARPAGSECWCSAGERPPHSRRRSAAGEDQHAFAVVQVALAGAVAVAKGALCPGGIAAQRPVVNSQMVDKRGAQLQPARLPGKPRARQLAAQPPEFFANNQRRGSAGWWRAGLRAVRQSDRGSSGRCRRRTTGPEYQSPHRRVAACACRATSSKSNPQLSSQPAGSRGRQRRTAAKIADTLFNHAPCGMPTIQTADIWLRYG